MVGLNRSDYAPASTERLEVPLNQGDQFPPSRRNSACRQQPGGSQEQLGPLCCGDRARSGVVVRDSARGARTHLTLACARVFVILAVVHPS